MGAIGAIGASHLTFMQRVRNTPIMKENTGCVAAWDIVNHIPNFFPINASIGCVSK
jgi:hypothetical protein